MLDPRQLVRVVALQLVFVLVAIPLARADSDFDLRESARAAMRAQEWTRAAELYAQIGAHSPADGAVQRSLGFALLRAGRYDAAIEAYRRAISTGLSPATNLYDIACAYALGNRGEDAVRALREAYAAGFANDELLRGDADLASLHALPAFRDVVGWADPQVTERIQQWNDDLDFLARRVREVHWRPFGVTPESAFDAQLRTIRERIAASTDLELRAAVQKLLASIGDGHTAVVSDYFLMHHTAGAPHVQFLPVEFFWYDDGVRIVATTSEHVGLLGARVTHVGGVAVDAACERLAAYVSRDNEWGARWGIMQALADPKLLHGVGFGDSQRGFELTVERLSGGSESVVLQAAGPEEVPRTALHQAFDHEPLLRHTEKSQHLWLQPVESALYVRIDGVRDGHRESFAEFTERIFEAARDARSELLVVDLRDNLGGQGHLTRPLLHRLIASERFNRDGGLYLLVGRKTFSAAMAFAAQVELHTHARFVGEPTGSRPNFVGETTLVQLPYSRIVLSISSRYHQNGGSNDKRFWIAPDLPAPPDFTQERAGRDPAIEAVLAEIRAASTHR